MKALEPVISAEIMQIHHSKHHAAYVNNYNIAEEKLADAQAKSINISYKFSFVNIKVNLLILKRMSMEFFHWDKRLNLMEVVT